jgi:hypothetical protein
VFEQPIGQEPYRLCPVPPAAFFDRIDHDAQLDDPSWQTLRRSFASLDMTNEHRASLDRQIE